MRVGSIAVVCLVAVAGSVFAQPRRFVREPLGTSFARAGILLHEGRLHVIGSSRNRRGWREGHFLLHDADPSARGPHDLYVRHVADRIFAVRFTKRPTPPDTSPCACTSRGGRMGERWFHVSADGSMQGLFEIDPDLDSVRWDPTSQRFTVVETRGPVRCPAGCTPAPAIRLITTRIYRYVNGRTELESHTHESEYTG